jgi:putative addiction module killer protein
LTIGCCGPTPSPLLITIFGLDIDNIYVNNMTKKNPAEIDVRYYEEEGGRRPFERFFYRISGIAAAKITAAISRLRTGNKADSKSVGKGVSELRIHWGPGYRLYYGWEGKKIVILLSGSSKKPQKKQTADIEKAQRYWADFKKRKG